MSRRGHTFRSAFPLAVLGVASAAAAVDVFHSPGDDSLAGPPALVRGHAVVPVWASLGNALPGADPCSGEPGSGDEVCQWAVVFETTGDLVISDVAWSDVGIGTAEDDEPGAPATLRAGTGGNASIGQQEGTRIASVAVTGTRGQLLLKTPPGFGFVDREGQLETVDPAGVVLAEGANLPWLQLSSNADHTCAVLGSGEIACFGAAFPVAPDPPAGVFQQIATGADFACALDEVGALSCWGDPPSSPHATTFLQISAGASHMCGLLPDLEVECWDDDPGTTGPIEMVPGGPFRMVSRGLGSPPHACAFRVEDSTVMCWGEDGSGQAMPPAGTFEDLAGGGSHTCGIRNDRSIECWGSIASPPSNPPYVDLTSGLSHSCAIRGGSAPGLVECWGDDSQGQAPTGPSSDSFRAISAADTFTCGIRTDGRPLCWGNDFVASNGEDTPDDVGVPLIASGSENTCRIGSDGSLDCWPALVGGEGAPAGTYAALDAGGQLACAVDDSGVASCWGDGTDGKDTPDAGLYTQVSVGDDHACGLHPDARSDCWGNDASGKSSPPTGTSFLQIEAGGDASCGIRSNLSVVCWGSGSQSSPPQGAFTDISLGGSHGCGLRKSGLVECWGADGFGQASPPPGRFLQVDADGNHSCGVRPNGRVECWGRDADLESSPPLGRFALVSAGGDAAATRGHTCGLGDAGAVLCWGESGPSQPPLDGDADGVDDAVDNCPDHPNANGLGTCAEGDTNLGGPCTLHAQCGTGGFCSLAQEDRDFDTVGDACDNCLDPATGIDISNGNQFDRDGDGIGDLCDNCVPAANPGQEDVNANGTADACEVPRLFVEGPDLGGAFAPPSPMTGTCDAGGVVYDPVYLLKLDCPAAGVQIGQVELGLRLPSGIDPMDASFGPCCTDQLESACTNAVGKGLGPHVDPADSYVKQIPGYPDTFFFHLEGNAAGGSLCPDEEPVLLATVGVDENVASTLSLPQITIPTQDGVLAAFPGTGFFEDTNGLPLGFDEYSLGIGLDLAPIKVEVRPALDDTSGRRWVSTLTSDRELRSVTVGFSVPPGSDTSNVRFLGCDDVVAGNVRSCDPLDPQNQVGPTIDLSYPNPLGLLSTRTVGPGGSLPAGARSDVLYVTLTGEDDATAGSDRTLVRIATGQASKTVTLGVIEVDSGNPDEAPVVTTEGALEVAQLEVPATVAAMVEPDGGSGFAVATGDIFMNITGATAEDSDADGIMDVADNCNFVDNPDQEDNGQLGVNPATEGDPNDVGDACECGEADTDGIINANDVAELRDVLTGKNLLVDSDKRCSVSGDTRCDIKDVVIVALALQGSGPGLDAVCYHAVPATERPDDF